MISRFPAFLKENVAKNFIRLRACGTAAKVTANPPPVRGRTGQVAGRALKAPGQCQGGKLACAGSVAGLAKPASCVPQGRGVAPQACRLLACGKAGKGTAKPPARTCTILSIKRGPQPPVRGRTGHAAFLRSARAGGCTPGMPASCVPQGRKGPRETSGAHALLPFDEARASARRSKARIAQREHPLKKGPFAGSFFAC